MDHALERVCSRGWSGWVDAVVEMVVGLMVRGDGEFPGAA